MTKVVMIQDLWKVNPGLELVPMFPKYYPEQKRREFEDILTSERKEFDAAQASDTSAVTHTEVPVSTVLTPVSTVPDATV